VLLRCDGTALVGVYRAGVPLGVEAVPSIDFWREPPSLVKVPAAVQNRTV
jgi:hypothetical protein